jgi:hypothetical protein
VPGPPAGPALEQLGDATRLVPGAGRPSPLAPSPTAGARRYRHPPDGKGDLFGADGTVAHEVGSEEIEMLPPGQLTQPGRPDADAAARDETS